MRMPILTSSASGFTETWGYAMRCIMHMNAQLIGERIQALELNQQQWMTLARLKILESTTAAQLARSMMQDAATMMRVLDKLEARGLVTRTRSTTDRRQIHVALSEAGLALALAIERAALAVHEQMLQGLSDPERAQWTQLLTRVLANGESLMTAIGVSIGR